MELEVIYHLRYDLTCGHRSISVTCYTPNNMPSIKEIILPSTINIPTCSAYWNKLYTRQNLSIIGEPNIHTIDFMHLIQSHWPAITTINFMNTRSPPTPILQTYKQMHHIQVTSITSKLVTGIVARLNGDKILYKAKIHDAIALRSTKATFIAACKAGKTCLCLEPALKLTLVLINTKLQLSTRTTKQESYQI